MVVQSAVDTNRARLKEELKQLRKTNRNAWTITSLVKAAHRDRIAFNADLAWTVEVLFMGKRWKRKEKRQTKKAKIGVAHIPSGAGTTLTATNSICIKTMVYGTCIGTPLRFTKQGDQSILSAQYKEESRSQR